MTRNGPTEKETVPEPIRGNEPGSFAESVLAERHPALLRRVEDAHPYPPEIRAALEGLREGLHGEIPPLRHPWPGADLPARHPYVGQRWLDVPWLLAEGLFYRLLLERVEHLEPGPWQGVDPFEPQKTAELADRALDDELAGLRDLDGLSEAVRLTAATDAAIWANRADLGFGLSDPEARHRERVEELVADDGDDLWAYVAKRAPLRLAMITDNAGRELLADLVWVDRMLVSGRATEVDLHVKPHPYFISDATTADVLATMRRLRSVPGVPAETADRLAEAMGDGRLTLCTHAFWCSPWPFRRLPGDLSARLAESDLTVLKGDLNYRKLVSDRHWPATTSFEELTGYFPAPVVSLRTLKSDVVVGLTDEQLTELDATGQSWRTDGTHALVQVNLP